MALLPRYPYLPLRLMASRSRFFLHSPSFHSFASYLRYSFFFKPRFPVQSLVTSRSFMSSNITTEAFRGTKSSKYYNSEQIQVLHAGGKFGGSSSGYCVSGGLHGVGLSVVNALSEELEVTVWRDGMEYQQKYSRGKPVTTLTCYVLSTESKDHQGSSIQFWPDKKIFTTTIEFDYNTLVGRIRELAFLNPKLTITLKKEDNGPEKSLYNEYFFAGGLFEYVKWLNTDKNVFIPLPLKT
ncbi:hypothetical protein CRYUN_Cryun34aG0108400 [Craigia yunnanensis]